MIREVITGRMKHTRVVRRMVVGAVIRDVVLMGRVVMGDMGMAKRVVREIGKVKRVVMKEIVLAKGMVTREMRVGIVA
jgi:hypothetical protein